jgi:alkylated DNA repair dioxygenase AlkB
MYVRNVIPEQFHQQFMDEVRRLVPDKSHRFKIYGKMADEHRLARRVSTFAHGNKYHGKYQPVDGVWPRWTAYLAGLGSPNAAGENLDTAIFHYYRNGDDNISAHSDKDAMNTAVVSFSFGETRTLVFKRKTCMKRMLVTTPPPTLHEFEIDMESGSMLIMLPGCQQHYTHQIDVDKSIKKPRANITLRNHGVHLTAEYKRLAKENNWDIVVK